MNNEQDMLKKISEILRRGNTAEVKHRKNDIIVLEVQRKIVYEKDR